MVPRSEALTARDGGHPPALDVVDSLGSTAQDFVPPKLAQVLAQAGRPYYDETVDAKARGEYYKSIDFQADGEKLFAQLGEHVRRTHKETLGFDAPRYLHGWVDLRPNLRLQSIYSPNPVATQDAVKATGGQDFVQKIEVMVKGRKRADGTFGPDRKVNKKVDFRQQAETWTRILGQAPADALQIAANIALVEGHRFYNGEHSVPQASFDRDRKARGDLHHLFTCERQANSHRGCTKYGEVPRTPENRVPEGWSSETAYEPEAGKGAVARATLYFLLHYPGKLGEKPGEYTRADLATLVKWHKDDPVSLYERHRNAAIQELQGNRNPLVDFPDLVDKLDFSQGLATWGRSQP